MESFKDNVSQVFRNKDEKSLTREILETWCLTRSLDFLQKTKIENNIWRYTIRHLTSKTMNFISNTWVLCRFNWIDKTMTNYASIIRTELFETTKILEDFEGFENLEGFYQREIIPQHGPGETGFRIVCFRYFFSRKRTFRQC